MTKINHTVLAIDPGITHFGYAILRGARLAAAGVHTMRATSEVSRQNEIRSITRDWIEDYRPAVVVLEATYHHRLHVFKTLHRAARTIAALARLYRIPVCSVSVRTVRRTLAGNGNATKRELAQAITILFPSLRVYLRQNRRWKDRYFSNLFDAVALAVFYKVRHPFTP